MPDVLTADPLAAYRAADLHGPEALARFLPPADDPDYAFILAELVRADLAYFAAQGTPRRSSDYAAQYPGLGSSGVRAAEMTRTPFPLSVGRTNHVSVTPMRREVVPEDQFPRAGTHFEGFRLVEELGRGGFARVYLAEELRLAGRPVVLKLSPRASNEPLRLARLQHTNIVPIQTAFQTAGLHVLQMPFFGRQTLADLLRLSRDPKRAPVPSRLFATTVARRGSPTDPGSGIRNPPLPDAPPAAGGESAQRSVLAAMPFPDAVVWILTRVAEGLAHAHARGILHLDLKPQNVLFSDDGQPMLLDFNLAADATEAGRERVGGTWPYMAAEQIREYLGEKDAVPDARTDLFAVGVLGYELLCGRAPFPPVLSGAAGHAAAIAEREKGSPGVRTYAPEVAPAVESVLAKLLAPRPEDRYQTADDLVTDLRRHAEHLPLQFAPNPSLKERAVKFRRRYPKLVAGVALGLTVAVSAGTFGAIVADRAAAARAADGTRAAAFRAKVADLRSDLAAPLDSAADRKAIDAARAVAAAVDLPADAWDPADVLPDLAPADRPGFADAAGELCLLLAHATGRDGATRDIRAAAAWNRAAAACYAHTPCPPVLYDQRADLTARGEVTFPDDGPDPDAAAFLAADLYVRAARAVTARDYAAAETHLHDLLSEHYNHAAGQYLRGYAARLRGDTAAALEHFHLARVLRPTDPRPAYQRGAVFYFQQRYAAADAEYSAAVAADPAHAPSRFNRAQTRVKLNRLADAAADYTAALAAGSPRLQVLTLRGNVYRQLGRTALAEEDFRAANDLPPVSETDYLVRATHRLTAKNFDAALADVDRALELNPRYLQAWQSKASILVGRGRTREAAAALANAVELFPGYGPASLDYAVLLARLGEREKAHANVAVGLANDTNPHVAYQAACVYSVTSRAFPEDREKAVDAMRRALRLGYANYDQIETDEDLAPVRGLKDFKAAVAAAKSLAK